VGTGIKKDESSTGRVWAVGLYDISARFRLLRDLKIINHLFFDFPIIFGPQ
jgi:hypothetical protein